MIRQVTIQTEGPMSLTSGRSAGFETETLIHVPGSTFRGAVANAYLENGGSATDPAFVTCFVDEKVRFTDLRPTHAFPWPVSVLQCADYRLGSVASHKLMDLLPRALRGESLIVKCPGCGAKLENIAGFAERQSDAYEPYQKVEVAEERRMHSEIDPKTLSVKPTRFHSAHAVCAGQFFTGTLVAADPSAESALETIWRKVKDGLYLGRGRSRGQGRVTFVQRDTAGSQPMVDRLTACNQSPGAVAFTCDFHSVSLFYDDWLRSRTRIEGTDLHDELGCYKPFATFAKTNKRGGWHAAAQLPRPEIPVLDAGSCFLFRRDLKAGESMEAEIKRIAPILEKLERDGCGERLAEGFGEVTFCHDIHQMK